MRTAFFLLGSIAALAGWSDAINLGTELNIPSESDLQNYLESTPAPKKKDKTAKPDCDAAKKTANACMNEEEYRAA